MAEEIITNPENGAGAQPEKTFTQADVDAIVGKRVAKAMKGMPSTDELNAFHDWQNNHKNDDTLIGTLTQERDTARNELEQYKREALLLKKGVPAEDVEYYAFKIGKLVTDKVDFEKATDDFFKDNKVKSVRVDMGAPVGGGNNAPTGNDAMNALIRNARK